MSMYLIRVGFRTSVGVQTQSMDQFYGRWSPDFRFGHDFLISVTKKERKNLSKHMWLNDFFLKILYSLTKHKIQTKLFLKKKFTRLAKKVSTDVKTRIKIGFKKNY